MTGNRWAMSPYPTGWFVIAYSAEINPKEVMRLHYFGQELVLFRGESGVVTLVDAYCPHLGTHLGVSGSVEGDCLRCPMHGWKFSSDGQCVEVPYADGTPHNAALRKWEVRETSGLIWTYYDPIGRQPAWEPPEISEYQDPDWTPFSSKGNRWTVHTHAQVVQENACDIHHLRWLHRFQDPSVEETTIEGPVLWSRFWHKRDYSEIGVPELIEVYTAIGIYGLGLSKQNSVAAGVIKSTSLCTTTPIDEQRIDLRMASSVARLDSAEDTASLHETILATTKATLEEDIPIWETRNYAVTGYYSGDKPLTTFRRWTAQFYPESHLP